MWNKDAVKSLLSSNDAAVERAVVALWKKQTEAEKSIHATTDANGVGFNALDADLLSSFAERISLKKLPLTEKQMVWARKKIMKYASQLAAIANANEAAKSVEKVAA